MDLTVTILMVTTVIALARGKWGVGSRPAFFVIYALRSLPLAGPGCGTSMEVLAAIERMVDPSLRALGYEVVRVNMTGGDGRRTLQVMVEREDRRDMTVDDCAAISRDISAILDVEDPLAGAYTLEVSSPGIDRPLVKKQDYERFAGFEAKLETHRSIDGRKRFKGRLAGIEDDAVRIDCDGVEAAVPLAEIARAKLVLTDELIAKTMNKQNGYR